MFKSLAALTIFALLGASVIVLPALAPQAKARQPVVLAKEDRLAIHSAAQNCSSQVWPNFDKSCLRDGLSGAMVRPVRLVIFAPLKNKKDRDITSSVAARRSESEKTRRLRRHW
jgi:hypothetical protein